MRRGPGRGISGREPRSGSSGSCIHFCQRRHMSVRSSFDFKLRTSTHLPCSGGHLCRSLPCLLCKNGSSSIPKMNAEATKVIEGKWIDMPGLIRRMRQITDEGDWSRITSFGECLILTNSLRRFNSSDNNNNNHQSRRKKKMTRRTYSVDIYSLAFPLLFCLVKSNQLYDKTSKYICCTRLQTYSVLQCPFFIIHRNTKKKLIYQITNSSSDFQDVIRKPGSYSLRALDLSLLSVIYRDEVKDGSISPFSSAIQPPLTWFHDLEWYEWSVASVKRSSARKAPIAVFK